MPQDDLRSLRGGLGEGATHRHIWARDTSVALDDLARGSALGNRASELHGRSVLVATADQLTSALTLIELDGIARRLVLLPPDVRLDHLPSFVADAGVDALVTSAEPERYG